MTDAKDLKRTEKLQIMLDDEEMRAIDDWRFAHRMPSRAAAIRELLRRGMCAKDVPAPDTDQASSADYRVTPH